MSTSNASDPEALEERTFTFAFHGNGKEYFKIWIVNIALTILTVGVYSAWAKVRAQRYFHSNTALDGSRFEYHGNPMRILIGRAIAVLMIAPTVVLLQLGKPAAFVLLGLAFFTAPWLIAQSVRFRLGMTSWRNIRFSWTGSTTKCYFSLLTSLLIIIVTFGLAYPARQQATKRLIINSSRYGTLQFHAEKVTQKYYGVYFMGAVWAAMGGAIAAMLGRISEAPLASGAYGAPIMATLTSVMSFIAYLVATKYVASMTSNTTSNVTRAGPYRLQSSMQGPELVALYLKNYGLLALTFGLYWPWTRMREMHYRTSNLTMHGPAFSGAVISTAPGSNGATGDEITNWIDIDVGL